MLMARRRRSSERWSTSGIVAGSRLAATTSMSSGSPVPGFHHVAHRDLAPSALRPGQARGASSVAAVPGSGAGLCNGCGATSTDASAGGAAGAGGTAGTGAAAGAVSGVIAAAAAATVAGAGETVFASALTVADSVISVEALRNSRMVRPNGLAHLRQASRTDDQQQRWPG